MRSALATGGRQDVPTLEEQALYYNLCILGIISPSLKQEGIELTRTTFRRSNNKALEYVLYRLYSIIEGKSRAQKDFKGMLPVLDKVQQAPFYQRIGDWMMELKKSGRIEPSVILPVSALKTNTSNRLVLLLLELSSVAVQQDLDVNCPGAAQAAYLPSAGATGLLDDSQIPGEVRLAISVTRAKQASSEFLACAASSSSICDAMEQRSLAFKKRYYELQAEIRQQDAVRAEAMDAPQGQAAASGSSPRSTAGSPTSSTAVARSGSGVLLGPAAAAAAAAAAAGAGGNVLSDGSSEQADGTAIAHAQQSTRPDPDALAKLQSLLVGLEEHLRVHRELSKALMTDGGHGTTRGASVPVDGGTQFGQSQRQQQQMLHPYQIDGRALAAELQAASNAAQEAATRGMAPGFEQPQRRQQGPKYGPDNIVPAFMSFSSMLSTLAPHVTQLAMAGENAGPPPLLQPTSHPSGHAAHVAHQLQVHGNASRQIAQLSRKVQEQSAAYGSLLRKLRQESCRAMSSRCEIAAMDSLDDDFMDVGPHLALPPSLAQPVRQLNGAFTAAAVNSQERGPALVVRAHQGGAAAAAPASSNMHPVILVASPCPSSVSAQPGPAVAPSAGASASTAAVPSAKVVTMTTAAPAAPELDEFHKLQARLQSLRVGQPGRMASQAPAAAAAAVSAAAPVSATSGNVAVGMFSPSATIYGIASSPMAMSTGPFSASARPPMSARAQADYEFTMASMQAAAAAVSSSTTAMSPLRNTQRAQDVSAVVVPLEARGAAEAASTRTTSAESAGTNTSAWPSNLTWLGSAAPGVGYGFAAAPPAQLAEPARQQPFQNSAPGWQGPQGAALGQLQDSVPASRRTLDAHFGQQQQFRHVQGGDSSTAKSEDSLHAASASSDFGGGVSATSAATATQPLRLRSQPVDAMAGSASTHFDRTTVAGHTHAESAVPVVPSSNGPAASGESRRVDLRSLLDDDEEDQHGVPRDSTSDHAAASAHSREALPVQAPSGGFSSRTAGFGATDSSLAVHLEVSSAHLADADADFGRLAAESEMLSQALMFGGGAAAGRPTSQAQPQQKAPAAAGLAVGAYGVAPEAGIGAWGSGKWDGALESGEPDRSFPLNITAPHSAGLAAGVISGVDVDNGNDVVMVDNDKDSSPGAFGKGPSAGWSGAGGVAGLAAGPGQLRQGKAGIFDAFGALVSPQQQQQGSGLGRPSHGHGLSALQHMPPPQQQQLSMEDPEILALKARMDAFKASKQ